MTRGRRHSQAARLQPVLGASTPFEAAQFAAACLAEHRRQSRHRQVLVFDIDDTLLRDTGTRFVVEPCTKALFEFARASGAAAHLVTARPDTPSNRQWTESQLFDLGVQGYASLRMAPESSLRGGMAEVSQWKWSERAGIARAQGHPVTLTVGDMWTDIAVVDSEEELDELDARFQVQERPWQVVRPCDSVCLWGLKLKDYS